MIEIDNNEELIKEFLFQAFVEHRNFYKKWSEITHQTSTVKSGYLSQHLASLITGVRGGFSGARGDDLKDGTEVKACTRLDQLDKCNKCNGAVARYIEKCLICNSSNIKRNNDSKWLFTIRSIDDLRLLTKNVKRVMLMLFDYPYYKDNDFSIVDIQSFEIYPSDIRHINFNKLMTSYYEEVYLIHRQNNPNKTPAPKNFWPQSYQFHICNPIQTFHARIDKNAVNILRYIQPNQDRTTLETINMPTSLLKQSEIEILNLKEIPQEIGIDYINLLPLRDIKGFDLSTKHIRNSIA